MSLFPQFEGEELQEAGIIDLLLEQPDYFPEGEQLGVGGCCVIFCLRLVVSVMCCFLTQSY